MIITIEKCTHAYGRLFLLVALMAAFPLSDGSVHGIESSLALPTFWDSHMVLQREPMAANIWGWAAPGTNVSVSIHFGGRIVGVGKAASIFSITDGEGLWSVDIPPQRAGSGYAIHVSDGSKNIELEDVAFGDVYLCSGQSNMQMDVGSTFNASAEIADSINYPGLRLATVDLVTSDTPQDDAPSKANYTWARSSPQALSGAGFGFYSATCYYFGRELYKHMDGNVPIGLVTSCWGGQTVETFSSPDALADTTCGGRLPPSHVEDNLQAMDDNFQQQYDHIIMFGGGGDRPQKSQLWNAMIHPLRRMRFTGAIWYQGEANANDPSSYACRFPAMITDWRNKFNLPDLSFVFVQLAGYAATPYQYIRAAQVAATQLPQVGYVTAIDLGDPSSPASPIHPRRKQEVGRRLSLAVRSIQYNERAGLVYTGPHLSAVQMERNGVYGSALRLSFEPGTADGLHFAGSPECTRCCLELPFHVLNASGKLIRVNDGKFRGSELYLAAGEVDAVYGIRYAWEGYPQCLLYNGVGGPDDHEGIAGSPFEWCAYPSGNPTWSKDSSCAVPDSEKIIENH